LLSAGSAGAGGIFQSLVLGIATGFLWAPCAGPILGLILTGAAINGPGAQTTLLLFAYALGAIASLAVATQAGGRVFAAMKRSFGAGEFVRRGLGVAVIAAVIVIASGWDTGVLTRLSVAGTNRLEQSLIDVIHPDAATHSGSRTMTGGMTGSTMMSKSTSSSPPTEGDLPALDGAVAWLNSSPLTPERLRGKVVMIDFWTYSCINCLRALPYIKNWYERYKDQGLVVVGVHSPEFAFEKSEDNVRRAVRDLGITYPVALDNNYAIWQAFNNRYWPAHYFVDVKGRIRGHHFGEGNYEESEQTLRQLLTEAGVEHLPAATLNIKDEGVQAAADEKNVGSPETYVGYERAEKFASPGDFVRDRSNS
jgi:thiol-disulfide isomerase/thioredoxin